MSARPSTIQSFWHRLLTAAAFVLAVSLNLAPAPQSEGTRIAKDHGGQLEAAIKLKRDLPQSPSARLDGSGDGGPGAFAAGVHLALLPAPAAQSALPVREAVGPRPDRSVRAGTSRAPPSI